MPDEQQSVKKKMITLLRASDAREMKGSALIKQKHASSSIVACGI
jgi:hypothetical protein